MWSRTSQLASPAVVRRHFDSPIRLTLYTVEKQKKKGCNWEEEVWCYVQPTWVLDSSIMLSNRSTLYRQPAYKQCLVVRHTPVKSYGLTYSAQHITPNATDCTDRSHLHNAATDCCWRSQYKSPITLVVLFFPPILSTSKAVDVLLKWKRTT